MSAGKKVVQKTEKKKAEDFEDKHFCNEPHGNWNSTQELCICEELWHGDTCEEKHCPGWNETTSVKDCYGNGMCVKGDCLCTTGWGMQKERTGPQDCRDKVCPMDCGLRGMCQDGACVCQDGWTGVACRLPACPDDCSGHGTCSFVSPNSPGQCLCEYPYELPSCKERGIYAKMPKCPNDCSGNGLCMNGKCVCTEGFFGADCAEKQCRDGKMGPHCQLSACLNDCTGKGLCFAGECSCDVAHGGPDCSIPLECYDACSAICLPDLTSPRCEGCKGECLTMKSSSVLGHHNPFVDMIALQTGSNSTLQEVGNQRGKAPPVKGLPPPQRHQEVSAVRLNGL